MNKWVNEKAESEHSLTDGTAEIQNSFYCISYETEQCLGIYGLSVSVSSSAHTRTF